MDAPPDDQAAARMRDAGDYQGAWLAARTAADTLRSAGATPDRLAASLILLGRIEEDLGNHAAARDALEEARSLAGGQAWLEATCALACAELAGVARSVADTSGAERLTAQACDLLDNAQAPLPPHVASAVLTQASLDALEAGEDAVAVMTATRALEATDAMQHGRTRARARVAALLALGRVHQASGRYDEAAAVQRSALAEAETTLGPASIETANALNDLGMTGKYRGRFDEAAAAYGRALALLDAAAGGIHPDSASIHHNLGGLAHARRDFAAGEAPARRAVAIRSATLGPDHPVTVLDRAALASILHGLGQDGEAEAILRDAIPLLETALGANHYEVAVSVNNLAAILQRRGALREAEVLYRRALASKESTLGPGSPLIATGLNNLATVLRRLGRLDEAETLYRRALSVLETSVEPSHPNLATTRANLERLHRERASGDIRHASVTPDDQVS
jgi:tetratricopeptide (TPR) repeat protein